MSRANSGMPWSYTEAEINYHLCKLASLAVCTQPRHRLYALYTYISVTVKRQAGSRVPYGASAIMIRSPWSPSSVMEALVSVVAPSAASAARPCTVDPRHRTPGRAKAVSFSVSPTLRRSSACRVGGRSPHCVVEFTRPTLGRPSPMIPKLTIDWYNHAKILYFWKHLAAAT